MVIIVGVKKMDSVITHHINKNKSYPYYYVGDKIRETFVAAACLNLETDYYTLEIYDRD